MSECKNPQVAAMLHAYELGLLDDDDRQQMEIHLLECNACFERLQSLGPASLLLRRDPDIRAEVSAQIGDQIVEAERAGSGRLSIQRLVTYAAAAVIVLTAGLVSYRDLLRPQPEQSKIQEVNLVATRSAAPAVVNLLQKGTVRIRFFVDSSPSSLGYSAILETSDSSRIEIAIASSAIDDAGFGVVSVATDQLKPGLVRLAVVSRDSLSTTIIREYYFKAR